MALSFAAHGLFAGVWLLGSFFNVADPVAGAARAPEIAFLHSTPSPSFPSPAKPILETDLPPLPLVPVDPVEAIPVSEPEVEERESLDPLLEERRFEELPLEPLSVEEEETLASEEREAVEEEPVGEEALPVRSLLESPEASYPRAAYLRKQQGTVILMMVVNPDGFVVDVEVIESSGHRLLDRAASLAARGYRFEAGEESMVVNKSFTFRLP